MDILEIGEQRFKWKREMVGSLIVQREVHDLLFDPELRDTTISILSKFWCPGTKHQWPVLIVDLIGL